MSRLINTELKSDSESSDLDLDSEKIGAKVNNKLMTKLEKSETGYLSIYFFHFFIFYFLLFFFIVYFLFF